MLGSLVLLTLLPLQQNQPTPPTEAEIQDAMAFGMKIAQWQNLPMTSFRHQGEDFFHNFLINGLSCSAMEVSLLPKRVEKS